MCTYMDVRTAHIRTLRRGQMVRDANVYVANRLIQLTQGVDSSVIDPKSVFGNLPG